MLSVVHEKGRLCVLVLIGVLLLLPQQARPQYPSNVENVSLNATLAESLTVTTSAPSVSFTPLLALGITSGAPSVPITTTWVLRPNRGTVKLVGYFDSTNALTDLGPPVANITSARVEGQVPGGTPTTFTPFTQTVPGIGTANASLELFSEDVTGQNKNKTRNDILDLQINLTGVDQPAGVYTGTLRIQAIAN